MRAHAPIMRDQTLTFKRFRSNKRGGGMRGGLLAGNEQTGQRLLSGDAERSSPGDVAIQMTELPPAWIDSADEARADLKSTREKMKQLVKLQEKRLRTVFTDDSAPDKDVEDLSSEISSYMKRCEQRIHEVKNRGAPSSSDTDLEFRLNVQRSLATQLQQETQRFRSTQKDYINKIQKRKQGALWEDPSGGARGSGFGTVNEGFTSDQLQELEGMEVDATERTEEISQIARSINELHTIFKELAVLVIDQGTILDRIDYNIEQVVHQSQEANVQLQKAEKSSKSNRATKCMIILAVIDLILLIILIVKSRH